MKLSKKLQITTAQQAIDALVTAAPQLSKGRLKDAMNKGAVLWRRGKQNKRLRRAQADLLPGDSLELNYDEQLLQRSCEPAVLIHEARGYSVWFKPAGMLSQGNEWGDHLSLLRFAELYWQGKRQVFLLHRLDREASGLVLIAHTKQAAAAFSLMLQQHKIEKEYRIEVKGQLSAELITKAVLNSPLDDKACATEFELESYSEQRRSSVVRVRLITGRKHQIRRHFAQAGHPVMGDPAYGSGNKNEQGLMLQAVKLKFICPFRKTVMTFELPESLLQLQI
ncbi:MULTISPECIES: RluA family pseudouridine synthase [Rheinheimera]|nr:MULTISPECIES: RluA family pseudouridine synthase [Rheinheimera]KOO58595.1 23S rRNA pseudouridylate synthase [Rheinheimera sp. KL1]GGM54744.1 pseudouridine synthase [Rheinheimera tangshanensis]